MMVLIRGPKDDVKELVEISILEKPVLEHKALLFPLAPLFEIKVDVCSLQEMKSINRGDHEFGRRVFVSFSLL